jgi:N-alpha-acetyl-L-2,4-diaminobutyrate deacetylase
MTDEPKRVSTNVDFEKDGKQRGFLAAAKSTNESAYGTVTIPITVIKGGTGPTIFFSAGVHGDEYEGQVALMKLGRKLDAAQVQGRVIIVPSMNLPATLAGARCSPIDGLNLNRVFPGTSTGSITETIAQYVSHVLLPLADIQADLHSGGKTLEYIPCIIMKEQDDKARERRAYDALMAFGAPIALIDKSLDSTGVLEVECDKHGILNVNTELGGAGIVSKRVVEIAETGAMNLLKHFGIVEGDVVTPQEMAREPTRLVRIPETDYYVMAPDDGLYEPFIELGDEVEAGQAIGQVHYPGHTDKDPWPVHTPVAGMLLCKRPPGRVERGDNIAIFAIDATYS